MHKFRINPDLVKQFWILDFGFGIDPTDQSGGLGILDLGFSIDSTDQSGGLYHQGTISQLEYIRLGFYTERSEERGSPAFSNRGPNATVGELIRRENFSEIC